MSVRQQQNVVYGLTNALTNVPLLPIVSNRAPTTGDMAALGTIWDFKSQNLAYIITSIVNNEATWVQIAQSAGDFVRYIVQTADANPTAIATFAMPPSSALNIFGNLLAVQNDFSAAAGFVVQGTFRRAGAGPAEVGSGDIDRENDFPNPNPDMEFNVVGNTIELQVTGKAATVINWTADLTTIITS